MGATTSSSRILEAPPDTVTGYMIVSYNWPAHKFPCLAILKFYMKPGDITNLERTSVVDKWNATHLTKTVHPLCILSGDIKYNTFTSKHRLNWPTDTPFTFYLSYERAEMEVAQWDMSNFDLKMPSYKDLGDSLRAHEADTKEYEDKRMLHVKMFRKYNTEGHAEFDILPERETFYDTDGRPEYTFDKVERVFKHYDKIISEAEYKAITDPIKLACKKEKREYPSITH